jgi:helicase
MVQSIHIPQKSKEDVVNIALDTIQKKKQALVFVGSKRSAEKQAIDIAKECTGSQIHLDLSEQILTVLPIPTDQCKKLALCVKKGIAFHHSGLASEQRKIIEDSFRRGDIHIICSTPTLAAGLDMPAFRTILKDVKRYSGSWGMQFIPVLEYEQMAGRAGRPGKEPFGEAILLASSDAEKDALVDKYVYGEIESIYSKLAAEPVLRTYVLSLLATGIVHDMDSLIAFFSKSFWAHQYQDLPKLELILERVIKLLAEYGFVATYERINGASVANAGVKNTGITTNGAIDDLDESFISAKRLLHKQKVELRVTPLGKRVSEVYIDPLSAHYLLKGFEKFVHKYSLGSSNSDSTLEHSALEHAESVRTHTNAHFQSDELAVAKKIIVDDISLDAEHTVSGTIKHNSPTATNPQIQNFQTLALIQLFTQCLELRPLLKVKTKESDAINQFLFENEEHFLMDIPTIYDVLYEDFFDSIKTSMYISDWINETTEDVLLTKYDIRPGEISAKNDMLDWLVYCGVELAKLSGYNPKFTTLLIKLRTRVKYGVKQELLTLLQLKQVGRVRARQLFNAGFTTISSLKKGDQGKISAILGSKLTKTVLEQLDISYIASHLDKGVSSASVSVSDTQASATVSSNSHILQNVRKKQGKSQNSSQRTLFD